MKKNTYLHSFSEVKPKYHLSQERLNEWTVMAHSRTEHLLTGEALNEEELSRYCVSANQIKQRYFECHDVDENWKEHRVYKLTSDSPMGVDIQERNLIAQECSLGVLESLYTREGRSTPDHLIHVSCTGYTSPSSPQLFFQARQEALSLTHFYHMGCYASLPAVRAAKAMIGSEEEERVDIIHNETCSLHMDSSLHLPEQMVVQTLFADGHIAYRASQEPSGRSFQVKMVHEKLVPDSSNDMTWIPGPYGMKMTLSRYVPLKIRSHIPDFIQELCERAEVNWDELKRYGIFAIHPGGPKIIESSQRTLDLRDDQLQYSRLILKERGNMSSATLPHIWQEILKSNAPAGTKVLSLAFGPGLTIFGSIFEVVGE